MRLIMFNCIDQSIISDFKVNSNINVISDLPKLVRSSILGKYPKLKDLSTVAVKVHHLKKEKLTDPEIKLELNNNSRVFISYSRMDLSKLTLGPILKKDLRVGHLVNLINDRYDLDLSINEVTIDKDILIASDKSLVIRGANKLEIKG